VTRFGLSISGMIQVPRDADLRRRVDEIVRWVGRSRELGFDYIVTGQHYLISEYQTLHPVPLLARLAAESGEMRLVATFVLPVQHPVELAETTGTLDAISGGRLTVMAARGYREEEYAAFGVARAEASARMRECLDCARALWSGRPVDFDGRYYHLRGAVVATPPLQRPPPVWIAADGDAGVRRAARWGLPWCINGHADLATLERQVALYREEAGAAGHDADRPLPMARELYCAPTREEALAGAARYLGGKYEVYAAWGQDKELPGRPSFEQSFEALAADRFIVGSPEDCARELRRYLALGVGDCHLRMVWAGMPAELGERSMELFAREVRPALGG
jgi:alkanesulfonate monooxygenase SsuD/methylene tetrahydromethanopterin reductase-like flavin-dependent oxidoreductase (luciferase family)